MQTLSDLPNLGPVVVKKLEQVGIKTIADLQQSGSERAWLMIRAIDPSACINMLMALEGAIQGVRWHNLPLEKKDELKVFAKQEGWGNKNKCK
jgi:DNA transformation protein and related proteins